ncbi:MAG: hypothetical protein ACUVS3_07305 [Thermodesulfobacteriota bacterium]
MPSTETIYLSGARRRAAHGNPGTVQELLRGSEDQAQGFSSWRLRLDPVRSRGIK